MLEGWKHDVRNVWWVIDYNRQSLDSVVSDRLFTRIASLFEAVGWKVITLKYGKLLEAAFERPGGAALRGWIDSCPNTLYSALTFKGGAAWRERLSRDLVNVAGIPELLADHDDAALGKLMTNLAGHDIESVLEAFHAASDDDVPTCFIAYTIKGFGLPFAGNKENHAGLPTPAKMAQLKDEMRIADGQEWDRFAGLDVPAAELERFLAAVPFAQVFPRGLSAPTIPVPDLPLPAGERMSTQEGFARILFEPPGSREPLAARIVTLSPDVTLRTNLAGRSNRPRGLDRTEPAHVFRADKVTST